jgi:SanA protein
MRLVLYAVLGFGMAAVALAILSWAAQRRLEALAAPRIFDDPARLPDVDVALVLGTAPHGPEGGPNSYLERRLDAAAALWRGGKVKYLLASGDRRGEAYDEPTAMRAGLIARGVPAEAIYCDFAGVRTLDSIIRAHELFGQNRLIVVSQHFHVARALFLARDEGVEAWGLAARDIGRPYSLLTVLRRYPSALRAYYDVWFDTPPRHGGKPVRIGVDPPQ